MSMLNWFSGKSEAPKTAVSDSTRPPRSSRPRQMQDKVLQSAGKAASSPDADAVDKKVKRHARREQLYMAIRECMTRAGVLSASYKFKVLSLDHRGDQFLVMMDVAPGLIGEADKLAEIETLMASTAKSSFGIFVTSVYWRTDDRPAAANAVNFGVSQPAAVEPPPLAPQVEQQTVKKPGTQRFDPIHDDEMAAFKQALVTSSAQHPATPDGTGKSRSGLRSFTLITGFEDTEMSESSAAPALSATQYGDLN